MQVSMSTMRVRTLKCTTPTWNNLLTVVVWEIGRGFVPALSNPLCCLLAVGLCGYCATRPYWQGSWSPAPISLLLHLWSSSPSSRLPSPNTSCMTRQIANWPSTRVHSTPSWNALCRRLIARKLWHRFKENGRQLSNVSTCDGLSSVVPTTPYITVYAGISSAHSYTHVLPLH